MRKKIFLVLLVSVLGFQIVCAQQISTGLHVVLSAQHFVGLELRAAASGAEFFMAAGLNGVFTGLRFSSPQTAGLYISPYLLIEYNQRLSFGFLVGWRTKLKELAGTELFLQGGVGGLADKPKGVVDIGFAWKF
ncbi:hypothetical protein [Fervidobacterium thailandense]|uniref:DUF3575 domain-containing protein n=1 Tax=Fervidobacterium thailandense TaxID=1008305 RepID=A0A1E3G2K4_9BACT|nr:hypothetical protein [Fervidobacterium thailandense]ODN30457.1 hypothetical protein A4H02_05350 [Fervidobacterium thailandense]